MALFKCEICDKTFKNKSGLSGHVIRTHDMPWADYQKKHTIIELPKDKGKPRDKTDEKDEASDGFSEINDRLDRMEKIINMRVPQEGETVKDIDYNVHPDLVKTNPFNFPQDSRTGPYMLETQGIGRRVLLTPLDIMIFVLWRMSGFKGDLSDFISDSINFMYDSRRPRER